MYGIAFHEEHLSGLGPRGVFALDVRVAEDFTCRGESSDRASFGRSLNRLPHVRAMRVAKVTRILNLIWAVTIPSVVSLTR